MEKKFVVSWKGSKKPNKQRKYIANAPNHISSKMICSMLSDELKKKHNKNNLRVIKGDRVKILRGQFKGKSGKVENVNIKTKKLYIENIELQKKDGTKTQYPIHHSNVMITELNLKDKKRSEIIKRK
ncbi:50S ribosomal protein L24 [archaeon]|jgi:large subunit ribosomal protein L24|nr:50S ribosomal protein L24 [archaeon]MBT4351314.1 50S ribosomal protein L24 [archaeon]MBT4646840.1 50S ribosomal protein L24 [archaeon]MBT6822085.1 50S ribosomal protein L24 [archaeon]MBT7392574.1 50S ribosomal protein L24 [archaeon]